MNKVTLPNLNAMNLRTPGVYAAYKDADGIQLTAADPALAISELVYGGIQGTVFVNLPSGRKIRCTLTNGKNYKFTDVNGYFYETRGAVADAIDRFLNAGNSVIVKGAGWISAPRH